MRILIFSLLFLMACENQELIECQNNLLTASSQRDSCQTDLEINNAGWMDCEGSLDSFRLKSSDLEFEVNVLTEAVQDKDRIISKLGSDLNECRDQHMEFLELHYSVKKETVLSLVASIQAKISAAEQSYHDLLTIDMENLSPEEQQDVLDAIETAKTNISYDSGQRALIGILFPIQVEN